MTGVRTPLLWMVVTECWILFILENIAYKKRATTSSGIYRSAWSADKAVDGNRDQEMTHDSCFHSLRYPSVWTVDLGQQYRIHDVRIYNRHKYVYLIRSAVLSLSNSSISTHGISCCTFPSNTATDISVYDVICDGRGRYFTIRHNTNYLSLCEVEIYECDKDHYGINCNDPCGNRNCATNTSSCDRRTGSCDAGCLPGWTAVDCTDECSRGSYGQNCSKQCTYRNCVGNSSCDHVTGSCVSGCKAGWMGLDCVEVCSSGSYGQKCSNSCTDRKCAGSSPCDHVRGTCVSGCEQRWTGEDCRACNLEHYGTNCDKACASRHCRGCSSCNSTGDCDSGCETGWTLSDCTEEARFLQAARYDSGHLVVAVVLSFVVGVVVGAVVCLVVWWRRNRRPHKTSELPPTNTSDARTDQPQNDDDVGPETRTYDSLHHDAKMTAETYCTIKSGNTESEAHAATSRNVSQSVGAQMYENLHHTSRAMDGEYSEIGKPN